MSANQPGHGGNEDSMSYQPSATNGPKMTIWKKEPTLQELKNDLELAKQSHSTHMNKIRRWTDLLEVSGTAKPKEVKNRSKVQPKLIRRTAEWRYSALTEPFLSQTDKLFQVNPATFEDVDAAKQNQLVLNWQFRTKFNRVKFIDELIRTTVDEGTAIMQVGWKRQTVSVQEDAPQWVYYEITQTEQLQALQQALSLKEENPRGYEDLPEELKAAVDYYEETNQPTVAFKQGTVKVAVDKVLVNQPTVVIRNPNNVYFDPTCEGDPDKALFVIVSFETNKSELLKDGTKYKNLDKVNWENNAPISTPDHETTTPQEFNFKDASRKKVVAIEYWGFYDVTGDGTLIPFVCTWIGDVMIRMEESPFPDKKLPFVVVPYLPIKRSLYGETDAELLEENQAIAGATTRAMIDLLGRSANGQQGIAKGMLDPLNRRRFDAGQDYEYNPNVNPQIGLVEHKFPELPQSAFQMLGLQNQEAESISGVKAFAGGISGESYGDVAAGIRGALDASSKREMAILRRIAKGVTDMGVKVIAMNGEWMSEEETVRVTNEKFVTVKREELAGNFDLVTDISTAEIDNAKAQDLAFMLQTIGPNSPPDLVYLIMAEIADLKRQPELAHKLRNFKPTPDPAAEMLKQLEIQKAQAEVQKIQSEIRLNEAKAQEVLANKDKKNLDYVEQETGTAHERDMEKQRGQAQGNQDLEVTKAILAKTKTATGGEKPGDVEAAVGYNQLSAKIRDGSNLGEPVPQ